jgi:hypothetical protein
MWPTTSNLNPRILVFPWIAPDRETEPLEPLPLITPSLTMIVSDHGGTQPAFAVTVHDPSALALPRDSSLSLGAALFSLCDLLRCSGSGSSLPPDADLPDLPTVPPAAPACAKTGVFANCSVSSAAAMTANDFDDFPISSPARLAISPEVRPGILVRRQPLRQHASALACLGTRLVNRPPYHFRCCRHLDVLDAKHRKRID